MNTPTTQAELDALVPDWPAFATRIRVALARSNYSYREAAELIGVDHATLNRIAKRGTEPSATNYILISHWLNARAALGDAS